MATIKLFLRGTNSLKKIYFRYRPSRNIDFVLATPFKIEEVNWDYEHQNWKISDVVEGARTLERKNRNSEIQKFNLDLAYFKKRVCDHIDSNRMLLPEELKVSILTFVKVNYFGHKIDELGKPIKPVVFSELIDFYIDYRSVKDDTQNKKPITPNTIKKYTTLKKMLLKFRPKLKVTDINDVFRNDLVKYFNESEYSISTQVKFISDIKMLCAFVEDIHLINKSVLNWEINRSPEPVVKSVSFSFEQLSKLKNTSMPTQSLDNTRDWLLISCYTAVRVSELFTFEKDNIIEREDDKYIIVQEQKNRNKKDKGMKCIYLMPEVLQILSKRDGNFPPKISSQKYNDYIKKVCEIAEFSEMVKGAIRLRDERGNIRKVKKEVPFSAMASSHIGRVTYVTLFSQYLPNEVIKMQTNHHSDQMVEHYNKTDEQEKLIQRAMLVAQAHKKVEFKIM